MANITFFACLLLLIPAVRASACAHDKLPESLASCIDGLKNALDDKQRYWFGTMFTATCPRETWHTVDCYNALDRPDLSVFDITGISGANIDRTLNVTFVSKPGKYPPNACDTKHNQSKELRFAIDPLSSKALKPWDVRNLPDMSWTVPETTPAEERYTLIVHDVAMGYVHGFYMNIAKNNLKDATVLIAYRGPANPLQRDNLYMFLIYKQQGGAQSPAPDLSALISSSNKLEGTLANLATELSLVGPVAISNVLVNYDAYSVGILKEKGVVNNCASLVQQAYHDQEHSRPFLPADPELSVFMSIEIKNKELEFEYCCKKHEYKERSFRLDPAGNHSVTPAETRSANDVRVTVYMRTMFPNTSRDFENKQYSLLCVDPDVPYDSIGTNDRPLQHWLSVNDFVGDDGVLQYGDTLGSYLGPMPPDDKRHFYYYMLYEQSGLIALNDTIDYGTGCTGSKAGRCLFNVDKFVADQNLTLVALSWMSAENSDYVNYKNGATEKCAGRPGYGDPCPTSRATVRIAGTLWMLLGLIVYLLAVFS